MSPINAREKALEIFKKVEYEGAYANLALNQALKGAATKLDRAFITELVYGTVRMRNSIVWLLEHYLSQPWKKVDREVRLLLMLGVYQLVFMDKVPPRAACNEMVNLTKKRGYGRASGFVNGVMRNIARNLDNLPWPDRLDSPIDYLEVVYSHPRWLVERWYRRFGLEETEALCRHNNRPGPIAARVNTLRTDREKLAAQLAAEGVDTAAGRLMQEALIIKSPPQFEQMDSFIRGLFILQDEASMLPARVLAPAAGAVTVDGCAAPGGKSTHLAQLMANRGRVIACDVHEHKLKLIAANKHRLGCTIIEETLLDARQLGERFAGTADYLLLDVPCSGLGVLSRRADARWRKKEEDIAALAKLQAEILEGAWRCLAPGGVLVYSTCTIAAEENENQVERFLARHPRFVSEDISPYIDFPLGEEEAKQCRRGRLQLLPHRYGVDGFFVARMRFKGETS